MPLVPKRSPSPHLRNTEAHYPSFIISVIPMQDTTQGPVVSVIVTVRDLPLSVVYPAMLGLTETWGMSSSWAARHVHGHPACKHSPPELHTLSLIKAQSAGSGLEREDRWLGNVATRGASGEEGRGVSTEGNEKRRKSRKNETSLSWRASPFPGGSCQTNSTS